MRTRRYWIFWLSLALLAGSVLAQKRLVGGPCEGCEAVFEFGERQLTSTDTLPGFEANGNQLKVTGTIFEQDGVTPASNVILYIYHTNADGIYPTRGDEQGWGKRHGYIRGWIQTGDTGRYTFYTSKPGSYGTNPAHIHPIILEPNGKYYYIDAYRFSDDPALPKNPRYENRGGSGIVTLEEQGTMPIARRDIILGKNVPDYE